MNFQVLLQIYLEIKANIDDFNIKIVFIKNDHFNKVKIEVPSLHP